MTNFNTSYLTADITVEYSDGRKDLIDMNFYCDELECSDWKIIDINADIPFTIEDSLDAQSVYDCLNIINTNDAVDIALAIYEADGGDLEVVAECILNERYMYIPNVDNWHGLGEQLVALDEVYIPEDTPSYVRMSIDYGKLAMCYCDGIGGRFVTNGFIATF